jgi:hypothetical protein
MLLLTETGIEKVSPEGVLCCQKLTFCEGLKGEFRGLGHFLRSWMNQASFFC